MSEHACICTQSDTVDGSMHIISLKSVNTHKDKEKATTYFFQANVMNKAVAVEEFVFKCKY